MTDPIDLPVDPIDPGLPGTPVVVEQVESFWDKLKNKRPTKKDPDTGEEEEIPPTPWELEQIAMAGWSMVNGYPVVLGERYPVGDFTYYASFVGPLGRVWRILTKDLP